MSTSNSTHIRVPKKRVNSPFSQNFALHRRHDKIKNMCTRRRQPTRDVRLCMWAVQVSCCMWNVDWLRRCRCCNLLYNTHSHTNVVIFMHWFIDSFHCSSRLFLVFQTFAGNRNVFQHRSFVDLCMQEDLCMPIVCWWPHIVAIKWGPEAYSSEWKYSSSNDLWWLYLAVEMMMMVKWSPST